MLNSNKINVLHNDIPADSHHNTFIIAKGDSGASAHYWRDEDKAILQNTHPNTSISVTLPNAQPIPSTLSGTIPLNNLLSTKAKMATVLPNLHSSSLISLGQLCDDNCKVTLDKKELNVFKENTVVMRGFRNTKDGLWDIPIVKNIHPNNFIMPPIHPSIYNRISPPSKSAMFVTPSRSSKPKKILYKQKLTSDIQTPDLDSLIKEYTLRDNKVNVIIRKKQSKQDLARYLHAACLHPTVTSFTKAIAKNNFSSWPGLTTKLILRHLPKSTYTYQGHLHAQKQGLQSTKLLKSTDDIKDELDDHFPMSDVPNIKSNNVCYVLVDPQEIATGYIDLTGRFPKKSSRGNEYILVAYHFDANHIMALPIKNRRGPTITEAWETIHNDFKRAGAAPNTYVLDNEKSKDLIDSFNDEKIEYQLVAPYRHCKYAERAIQTFKEHFKSCIAATDPKFPLSEWDRLIPQTNITINLLRNARVNPKLSAYSYIYGEFNFRATPLAPPGTKVVAHISPDKRGTWELNGEMGWYVGPSLQHYRCVKCYFPRTREVRDCDTVEFFLHEIPFPRVTLNDHLKQAASDIISILSKPPSSTVPSLMAGESTKNALLEIAKLLHRAEPIPDYSELPPDDNPPPRVISDNTPTSTSIENINPNIILFNNDEIQSQISNNIDTHQETPVVPAATLQTHSNLPKNLRFQNNSQHNYRLRSTTKSTNQPHLIAQHLFNITSAVYHIFREDGKKETIDSLLKGKNSSVWERSLSNEWGRLAQGNDNAIKGTDTIQFIFRHEVPADKKVTYASYVCDYRPLKDEPYRVRITVGGDKLEYPDDAGSPAANLLETKILLNSVISDADKGARFMCADIKDHFLATPMDHPEYMRVQYKYIPNDIRHRYNLNSKVTSDGYIYIKIQKGMPGLKQAAILAYRHLKNCLEPFGYQPIPGTIGLWHHKSRPTKFCLCVDDFGIKYWSKEDAQHLCRAIGANFRYTVDEEGRNYCGLQLDWNYKRGYVDISMPKYIPAALKKLNHIPKVSPQHSPHRHTPIIYRKKGTQQMVDQRQSHFLPKEDIKTIQSITGTFLYYARALDSTMLPALNEIACTQAKPTQYTREECDQIMDYAATYPQVYVRFHASDMILAVDSDAAYLVMPNAKSRIAGYFQLNDHPDRIQHPDINGAILVECKALRNVMSSVAETETAGVFHNAQRAIPIHYILEQLGHVQPPTRIKADNSTTTGFIHNNIHQKKSKSWDMRYHWLRDREAQQQFSVYWDRGANNHADYFTKHHPTKHHLEVRQKMRFVRDKTMEPVPEECDY